MLRKVDRATHQGNAACHTRRRLVVNDEDGLDAPLAIIAEPFRNEVGIDAMSPGTKSTSRPKRAAIARHSVAKWPVSYMSTRSPGDSVLTRAASHAPVPEAG